MNCAKKGKPPTSLTGTVFAPNGTLPMSGVNVYVPRDKPPRVPRRRGSAAAAATRSPAARRPPSDRRRGPVPPRQHPRRAGHPARDHDGQVAPPDHDPPGPVVRRDGDRRHRHAAAAENKGEGDLPRIAITTGKWDTLECLVRKLGIDDEPTIGESRARARRIHLYEGNGVNSFEPGFPGGAGDLTSATRSGPAAPTCAPTTWCSCRARAGSTGERKPQAALDAMKEYADLGGRVFASHWHNIWIAGQFQDPRADAEARGLGHRSGRGPTRTRSTPPSRSTRPGTPRGRSFVRAG